MLAAAGAMAGSALMGYIQNRENIAMQKDTNAMNAAMAREQMAFQERMSNTAHQREMEDLRNAGLNPILSATGGSGASVPSGTSSTAVAPKSQFAEALSGSINSGLSLAAAESDLNFKNSQTAKTLADTANSLEQAKVISEQITGSKLANAKQQATMQADIQRAKASTVREQRDADAAYYNQQKAATEASRSDIARRAEEEALPAAIEHSRIDKDAAKYDAIIDRVSDGLGAVTSALNVSNLFRTPTVKSGSQREGDWLKRSKAKGLKVK